MERIQSWSWFNRWIFGYIYIGEAEYYTDGLFVDGIIEQQQQDAYSEYGESTETYLENITDEEKDILQERLNKVWKEFKKEFNHEATFYTVANEKKYEFNIYSEEFKKYYKEENWWKKQNLKLKIQKKY